MADRSLNFAKITGPLVADVFDRPRLTKVIDAAANRPILWVSGPAGCGKTTLVSGYVRGRGPACLWYQVGPGDADPASFFHYLRLASRAASPRSRKPLPPSLAPEFAARLPVFTRRFFRDLFGRLKPPFVVVFDNVQEAPDGSLFADLLREGLGQIPPGGRVVLVSRSSPPPVLARFRAGRQMAEIGWPELRLTRAESDALLAHWGGGPADPVLAERMFEATGGWIAGLVLLAAATKGSPVSMESRGKLPDESLFDYFASEVFCNVDPDGQRFMLRSALLPEMTHETAEQVTGDGNAARILARFAWEGFFTDRRGNVESVYQYHPMFRAYLLRLAEETLGTGELDDLRKNAARILERAGQVEAAADLLVAAGEWSEFARLISVAAPAMAAQGRIEPIGEWVGRLPPPVRDGMPALLMWDGISRLFGDPVVGRARLEKAFELAKAQGDAVVQWLAWSAIVESYMLELKDLTPLNRWLAEFRELRRAGPGFPSEEIEVQALNAFLWIFGSFPGLYEELEAVAARLLTLAQNSFDSVGRGRWSFMPVFFYSWYGEMAKAAYTLEALCPPKKEDCPPELWIHWKTVESCYAWLAGSFDRCQRAFDGGMEIIRDFGAEGVATYLITYGIAHALSVGNLAEARRLIDWLRSPEAAPASGAEWRGSDVRRWHYQFFSTWYELQRGNATMAREHAERSFACNAHQGSLLHIGSLLSVASAAVAQDDVATAQRFLAGIEEADPMHRLTPVRIAALYAEADLARRSGEASRCRDALREAFRLGRESGGRNTPLWLPKRMTELCVIALEAGIEVPFVQEMVRERHLRPASPPQHVENWPWPLRIHTLGDFAVVRDDERLAFLGKGQQRPLELLKALIAFGGKGVGIERLADALWPDADGDAACTAFDSTLYRLRRLLGVERALVLGEGRLTLSPHLCWVDVWALGDALAKVDAAVKDAAVLPETVEALQENVVTLYPGAFLDHLSDAPWALSARTRLSLAVARCLHDIGRYWERHDHRDSAAECYRKAIEIGASSETLDRSLWAALRRVTGPAEAVAE